jgi:hypothetical protein
MRRVMPCRTFRGWHATRRVASIASGQREVKQLVQIQADGGCAAWRAETIRIVCDFSAADGSCRDAHIDIRRESQRQTRPPARRRSKLHVAAQTRTDACRLDGRPCAELAGRGSGGRRSPPPGDSLIKSPFLIEIRFIKFNSTSRAYQTKSSPLEGLARPGLYHDRHPMVRSKGPPVKTLRFPKPSTKFWPNSDGAGRGLQA